MILENLKNKKIKQEDLLRILIGLVFFSAGIFRLINPSLVSLEFFELGISNFFYWPLVLFESVGGFLILIKASYFKQIIKTFIFFIIFALILAFYLNYNYLLKNISELFVFNLNPTDVFLHFVFLLILVSFVLKKE